LSAAACDLLAGLLSKRVLCRLPLCQALQHPWLQETEVSAASELLLLFEAAQRETAAATELDDWEVQTSLRSFSSAASSCSAHSPQAVTVR